MVGGMHAPGGLLASGRDCDIFEYGAGLVLRRSRKGHSLAPEWRSMEYLRGQGYPVPAVKELSEDGCELVMERVEGPSMLEALAHAPWTIGRQASTLADLHIRLHEIEPPPFLLPAPVAPGGSIVHLDLHPLNVIIGRKGPVVIDWTNAALSHPAMDVAVAWLLMAVGEIPGSGAMAKLLGFARGRLIAAFLAHFDVAEVAAHLRGAVEWKSRDPNMGSREVGAMRQLVKHAEALPSRRSGAGSG
jgi:aminoglycoside phosphotransferase (APT) family kinase protein